MMNRFSFVKLFSLICIVLLTLCTSFVCAETMSLPVLDRDSEAGNGYTVGDIPVLSVGNNDSFVLTDDQLFVANDGTKWLVFDAEVGGGVLANGAYMNGVNVEFFYYDTETGKISRSNMVYDPKELEESGEYIDIADMGNGEVSVAVPDSDKLIPLLRVLGDLPEEGVTFDYEKRLDTPNEYIFDDFSQTVHEGVETVNRQQEDGTAGWFESLLTRILASIGDLFLRIVKEVMGESFTIDGIIFNAYSPTIVDFWGTTGGYTSSAGIKGIVNSWFNVFRNLAFVVYLVILVYVAIKIFLVGDMGRTKKLISAWLLSVIWLFMMPYIMKYTIQINNAVVKEIGKNRTEMLTYFNTEVEMDFENAGTPGEDTRTHYIDELKGRLATAMDNVFDNEDGMYRQFAEELESVNGLFGLLSRYYDAVKQGNTNSANRFLYDITEKVEMNRDNLPEKYWNIDTLLAMNETIRNTDEYDEMMDAYGDLVAAQKAQDTDLMGEMAVKAGKTGRFVYVVVFYLLLGQLIFIALLYFKRIFMLAALIIIFPLVMVTYVIDKMGDGKAQTFSSWCKEYLVNVIVQIFHAIVYVILIEAGIKIYVNSNHESWLFFLLSIMFIFPAERILRSIFGLQASTLGQLNGSVAKIFGTAFAARTVARSLRNGGAESVKAQSARLSGEKTKKVDNKQKKADRKRTYRQNKRDMYKSKMKDATRARKAAYAAYIKASEIRDGSVKVKLGKKNLNVGFNQIGDATRKLKKRTISGYYSSGTVNALKSTGRVLRKGAGIAAGTAVAFGAGGSTGDFVAGAKVAQTVGGFTGKPN